MPATDWYSFRQRDAGNAAEHHDGPSAGNLRFLTELKDLFEKFRLHNDPDIDGDLRSELRDHTNRFEQWIRSQGDRIIALERRYVELDTKQNKTGKSNWERSNKQADRISELQTMKESLEERLTKVEKTQRERDSQYETLAELHGNLEEDLESEIGELENNQDDLEDRQTKLNQQHEELKKRTETLEHDCDRHEQLHIRQEEMEDRQEDLEKRLESMEQHNEDLADAQGDYGAKQEMMKKRQDQTDECTKHLESYQEQYGARLCALEAHCLDTTQRQEQASYGARLWALEEHRMNCSRRQGNLEAHQECVERRLTEQEHDSEERFEGRLRRVNELYDYWQEMTERMAAFDRRCAQYDITMKEHDRVCDEVYENLDRIAALETSHNLIEERRTDSNDDLAAHLSMLDRQAEKQQSEVEALRATIDDLRVAADWTRIDQ